MDFAFTAVIHRPPADVFAFFRDVDQYNEHEGSPVPVLDKITDGPVGVGTRYREVVMMLPFIKALHFVTMTILSEVTDYEPGHRLASWWRSDVMAGQLVYTFESVDGGTLVVQQMSLHPRGALRLFSPLIKATFSRVAGQRLQDIKALLEGQLSS